MFVHIRAATPLRGHRRSGILAAPERPDERFDWSRRRSETSEEIRHKFHFLHLLSSLSPSLLLALWHQLNVTWQENALPHGEETVEETEERSKRSTVRVNKTVSIKTAT